MNKIKFEQIRNLFRLEQIGNLKIELWTNSNKNKIIIFLKNYEQLENHEPIFKIHEQTFRKYWTFPEKSWTF
jgi:hypothetical protein